MPGAKQKRRRVPARRSKNFRRVELLADCVLALTGERLFPMEFDLEGEHAERAYSLLASLVIPRPIAWVTTLGEDGVVNAAPFSFFNLLGADPPNHGVAPGDRDDGTPKDTPPKVMLNN
jgi:hypothetical protein